jgi:hypothetical protein
LLFLFVVFVCCCFCLLLFLFVVCCLLFVEDTVLKIKNYNKNKIKVLKN